LTSFAAGGSWLRMTGDLSLTLGVGFALLAVLALVEAYRAAQWRRWRRFSATLASSIPLAGLACLALWLGILHPTANFWGAVGFGRGWVCDMLGSNNGQVCFRDLPSGLEANARQTSRRRSNRRAPTSLSPDPPRVRLTALARPP
jgi:hypothetical protein